MPPNASERYTAAVRDLLLAADAEAATLGHRAVTSEHLLLALIAAPGGTAGAVFAGQGWGPDRLRQILISALADRSYITSSLGARTLDFLQALELAEAEADHRGHYYVDPDHLLLGVISESTAAAQALAQLGIMRSAIYVAVEQRMWGVED
jgi:ATP-dependent Clp protease ATP-binding subunit ClpC